MLYSCICFVYMYDIVMYMRCLYVYAMPAFRSRDSPGSRDSLGFRKMFHGFPGEGVG